jgi:MoaA/NifB/PqqE/SkfB family radical SAM enzyme
MNIAQIIPATSRANRNNPHPIKRWKDALTLTGEDASEYLRAAYREHWPTQGELIFTGACEFTCQHCIYPPSYARLNRGLSVEQWDRLLDQIFWDLGIQTFVYGGRSLSVEGLDVLTGLRRRFPDARIGLIDNGISMLPVQSRLADVRADWIDISLDGQEREHDLQRGRSGSFKAGLAGALWLVQNGVAPKVNILTCLTTLNRTSVIPMIRELNAKGFKNFFITPVTIVDGALPSPDLRLSADAFADFIAELRAALPLFDDAWVEVNLYAAEYAEYVARLIPDIWADFSNDRDGLSWHATSSNGVNLGGTELYIRYYPTSLTGTRELIVNTNGDVILPKSMSAGQIAQQHVVGNLLRQDAQGIVEG